MEAMAGTEGIRRMRLIHIILITRIMAIRSMEIIDRIKKIEVIFLNMNKTHVNR